MKFRKTLKGNIEIKLKEDEAFALARLVCNSKKLTMTAAPAFDDYTGADEELIGMPLWNGLKSVDIKL